MPSYSSFYPSDADEAEYRASVESTNEDEFGALVDSVSDWSRQPKTVAAVYPSAMLDDAPIPSRIYALLADMADILNLHIKHTNGNLEITRPLTRKELETVIVNQWRVDQRNINHDAWKAANPEDSGNE